VIVEAANALSALASEISALSLQAELAGVVFVAAA